MIQKTDLLGLKIKIILVMFGLSIASCNQNKQQEQPTTKTEIAVAVPEFNADSSYEYIVKQVQFGPRNPGSKGHQNCGLWLAEKLNEFADTVIVQSFRSRAFDGKTLDGKNIIASFNPKASNRIMLCAHWDTRPFADQDSVDKEKPISGANDGGSGVGILIEVARALSLNKTSLGIDIILFDLEDYGQPDDSKFPPQEDTYCLGSQYWAINKHQFNYDPMFGILLDMVGGINAKYTQEGTSNYFAQNIVDKVWSRGNEAGYGDYFINEKTKPIIDDHFYINKLSQIKCIDVIDFDHQTTSNFWKHWHTHGDTIDKIDKKSLKAVGQTVLSVVYHETAAYQ